MFDMRQTEKEEAPDKMFSKLIRCLYDGEWTISSQVVIWI